MLFTKCVGLLLVQKYIGGCLRKHWTILEKAKRACPGSKCWQKQSSRQTDTGQVTCPAPSTFFFIFFYAWFWSKHHLQTQFIWTSRNRRNPLDITIKSKQPFSSSLQLCRSYLAFLLSLCALYFSQDCDKCQRWVCPLQWCLYCALIAFFFPLSRPFSITIQMKSFANISFFIYIYIYICPVSTVMSSQETEKQSFLLLLCLSPEAAHVCSVWWVFWLNWAWTRPM